jgi:hypothetical protein
MSPDRRGPGLTPMLPVAPARRPGPGARRPMPRRTSRVTATMITHPTTIKKIIIPTPARRRMLLFFRIISRTVLTLAGSKGPDFRPVFLISAEGSPRKITLMGGRLRPSLSDASSSERPCTVIFARRQDDWHEEDSRQLWAPGTSAALREYRRAPGAGTAGRCGRPPSSGRSCSTSGGGTSTWTSGRCISRARPLSSRGRRIEEQPRAAGLAPSALIRSLVPSVRPVRQGTPSQVRVHHLSRQYNRIRRLLTSL